MNTVIFFIVLALATWFAITNAEAVEIDLFLWRFDISLAVIVGVSFVLGFFLGVLRVMPGWFNKRSSLRKTADQLLKTERERDELKKRNDELEKPAKAEQTSLN